MVNVTIIKTVLKENASLLIVTALSLLNMLVAQILIDATSFSLFKVLFLGEMAFVFAISLVFVLIAYSKSTSCALKGHQLVYNLLRHILYFICLTTVISCFCLFKDLISIFHPWSWDAVFVQLDRLVHFGYYPHEMLGILPDDMFAGVIIMFDWVYSSWFIIMYGYFFLVILIDKDRVSQQRFIISFALVWVVIGGYAALLLSSVGPAYLHIYFPELSSGYDNFIKRIEAVNAIHPLEIIYFRDLLLSFENDDILASFSGIAAMPSVHVAMAVLLVFHSYAKNIHLFTWCVLFMMLTQGAIIVSTLHYAIDGYVSFFLVWGIWSLTRHMVWIQSSTV